MKRMQARTRRSEPPMPKRLLLALAVAALVIAACNSSPAPSPTYTPSSPTPNPKITKAGIEVTVNGTPLPRIPVQISTPRSTASPRPGTPFETHNTNHKGIAHFTGLTPSQTYCWVAIVSPSVRGSQCATWEIWQAGTITLPAY
jgi:hypothetical protein